MKKVAIISIQGVPARYGGFESLVENLIGENCSKEVEYTVYCSSKAMPERLDTYKNAKLKYIPLNANGWQSVFYDTISLIQSIRGYDSILILGISAPIFWLYKKICKSKLIVNVDGLSQFRDKYNKFTQTYIALLKKNVVKRADVIVSDNKGIQDFVKDTYGKDSHLIAYGGDHVLRNMSDAEQTTILEKYGLNKDSYAVSVCRIEPENNCHVVLEGFAKNGMPLAYIGNWERSEYGRTLKEEYSKYSNIHILDPIYDLDILYALRNNAKVYIHGHSVGGTNPSLVEAMFFAKPIIAYDVVYNRETTNNQASYFNNANQLDLLLKDVSAESGSQMLKFAEANYTWKHIAKLYESLY